MKAKKIITTLILLVLSIFSLYGCASLQFVCAVDGNGTIIDRLVIELDEAKINKSHANPETVKNAIQNDIIAFHDAIQEWKGQFSIVDTPEIALSLENGILFDTSTVGNKITVSLEFQNWTMFGLFYGFITVDGVEYEKAMSDVGPFLTNLLLGQYGTENMGLFLYKYSHVKDSGFIDNLQGVAESGDTTFSDLYEKYRTLTNNYYETADLDISQVFAYPDEKLYSNADETEVTGGLTFMIWNLSDKSEDFEMEIYKLGPRAVAWYVIALIISALVAIALIIKFSINSSKKAVSVKITKEDVEKNER